MNDFKNQVITLLKKCPKSADFYLDGASVRYDGKNDFWYDICIDKKREYHKETDPDFMLTIWINNPTKTYNKTVGITEKEFMEIKWKMEEWSKVLEEKAFEDFKDFAEEEPTSMDDLLND